jgi:transposase
VQAFVATHPADYAAWYLPPYAPDLNPGEQANSVIKGRIANALPADIAELRALDCRSIRYLQRHPGLVANFFRHAGLHVKQPW